MTTTYLFREHLCPEVFWIVLTVTLIHAFHLKLVDSVSKNVFLHR